MTASNARPADLRTACLDEAARVIAAEGVEALNLREIARRLGVSHQAPYRHFPSKDALVEAVLARAFRRFALALDGRDKSADPHADLHAMGIAYLGHAAAYPLEYRLMFASPPPDAARHPEAKRDFDHAFSLLTGALARLHGTSPTAVHGDALFILSALHGLASLQALRHDQALPVDPAVRESAVEQILSRIGGGIFGG